MLAASGGGTLEIRDNSFPSFGGAVNAVGGGTVFFNGFDTTFAAGSSISLTAATFKSSNTTGISSSVTVGAGNDSTIDVQVNRFLDFNSTSTTTLNGNLRLVTNNGTLHAGATFSGAGALNVAAGSSVGAENLANINVLVKNDGNFLVGGFNVGRVDVKDFQQSATGHLLSQLGGTGLNQFDRLVVNGAAQLAGALDVTLTGGFVPALGNTFNIVSATAGISGTFAVENMPSLSGGLAFDVVYSPTLVQLVVTNTLLGDFNRDGHVNATDIPVMMVALSDLNAYKSTQV